MSATWIFAALSFVLTFWIALVLLRWPWGQKRNLRRLLANVNPEAAAVETKLLVSPKPGASAGLGRYFVPEEPAEPGARRPGWSSGGVLVLTAGMAVAGFLAGVRLRAFTGAAGPWLGAVLSASVPMMLRARRRRSRLLAMEEQFPDALDFLGRSLRAGNAFSISLELLTDELSEPLRSEFLKVTREHALGASLETALRGLIARVPLVEVRFFVSAVLLQRETGGNLGEVLTKLSQSIRSRMTLRGAVDAASAQGKLTAKILSALPLVVMGMLRMLSPNYLDPLMNDPMGHKILMGAVVSLVLGHVVMKKITEIEV